MKPLFVLQIYNYVNLLACIPLRRTRAQNLQGAFSGAAFTIYIIRCFPGAMSKDSFRKKGKTLCLT